MSATKLKGAILLTAFIFVFFVLLKFNTNPTSAQETNQSISCKVHTYLVDDSYRLPFKYNSPEIVNGSSINKNDSIVYLFEILNKSNQKRVTLNKVTTTQVMANNEPIEIVQTNPINGSCSINQYNKSIICNTSYSFAESAHYPIEYLFKVTDNPNSYPKTSTLFNIETDAGNAQCASMLMIKNLEYPNKVYWKTPFAELKSDDFYIKIGDQKFFGKDPITIHSNPGIDTTTLELTWNENGVEMRLYFYFKKTVNNMWEMYELRSYNGLPNGDWIYYKDTLGRNISGSIGQSNYILERKFIPTDNSITAEVYCKECSINSFMEQNLPISTYGYSLQAMIGLEKDEVITVSTDQNTGYGVNVVLRDSQNNIVRDQSSFSYEWKVNDSKFARLVTSAPLVENDQCLYGIQKPCPSNHADIIGLTAGKTTISVNVRNSSNQIVASTSFPVLVKEFGSITPIDPNDLSRLQEEVNKLSDELNRQKGILYDIQQSLNKISDFIKKFFKSLF